MSTDPEFFDERREWSQRKHTILSKYLNMATTMLGNVYYVDAFAGRGWYGSPSGEQIKGSPLLAAELSQEYRDKNRKCSLRCINVERDRALFQQLETATAPYREFVTNINSEFTDAVDRILPLVGNDPVICFLDPFGVKGVDLSTIRRLLRRGKTITDLWIRLDVGTIGRLDGFYEHHAPGADENFDILTRVYGIADNNKLHSALQASSAEQRRKRAAKLYMDVLLQEYIAARGKGVACRYPIRTLDGTDKYYLIFAAGDPLPLLRTSDILYDIEEQYKADKQWYREQSSGQLSLMSLDPSPDDILNEKVRQISEQIFTDFYGKSVSRETVNAHLIMRNNWFGRIKGTHLTKALKGLVADGKATINGTRYSDDKTVFTFPP